MIVQALALGLAMLVQRPGFADDGPEPDRIKIDTCSPFHIMHSRFSGNTMFVNIVGNCNNGVMYDLEEIPLDASPQLTAMLPESDPDPALSYAERTIQLYMNYVAGIQRGDIFIVRFLVGDADQYVTISQQGELEFHNMTEHDALMLMIAQQVYGDMTRMQQYDHEREERDSRPPSTLRTPNGVRFRISQHRDLGETEAGTTLADTNCSLERIRVRMDDGDKRGSIMHELMHVASGCSDRVTTLHRAIYDLSDPLLRLLQENPDMVDYLTKRKR